MADIFVSYATEDRERVRPLVEALEAGGLSVWWDRDVPGGADFSAEIEKEIHAADAVIVAWSTRSVASTWVRDEAAIARDTKKLVPIRLDSVSAPLGFRQFQVIHLEGWNGDPGASALRQVLAALQRSIGTSTSPGEPASSPIRWSSTRRVLEKLRGNKALAVASGLALAFAVLAVWQSVREIPAKDPQPLPAARFEVPLPPGVVLPLDTQHPVLAVSPDGSQLVFVGESDGRRQLYKRRLADSAAQPIAETEGAAAPFFSPDGAWIAFFEGNMLKKVSSSTGAPIAVNATTAIGVNRGAAWITDTTVVLAESANSPLSRSSMDGLVSTTDGWDAATDSTVPAAWPDALPGAEVLFTENAGGRPSEARIAVLSLATGKVRPLILGGTSPRYSRTGHVLFARGGRLYAVDFDSRLGEASGPERPLSARVITESFGTAQYAVGGNGVLAYIAGDPVSADHELVWVDRSGSARAVLHNTAGFRDPRLSPDGTRLALTIPEGPNWDVWILDLARGTLSRVTSHPGEDFSPVWSPDGQELVIGSEIGEDTGEGGPVMAWIRGSGERPEQLVASPGSGNWELPTSWSPDGDWIAYVRIRNRSGDIFLFPTDRSREPVPFLETPNTNEFGARFSPDAKWIAYVSDETGERQVYVRSFPKPGRANLISTNGGVEPVWSKDGRELFYRNGDALIVVALGRGSELAPAVPRTLFRGRYEMSLWGGESANYDVSPDGQRFLMIRRKTPPTAQVVQVVLNWPAVLLEAR